MKMEYSMFVVDTNTVACTLCSGMFTIAAAKAVVPHVMKCDEGQPNPRKCRGMLDPHEVPRKESHYDSMAI